jgi:hypothetical protein
MKKTSFLFKAAAILVIAFSTSGWAFAQTEISDRAGLEAIKGNLSGSYVLTADIDLAGSNWDPLGEFTGTLDGDGHVISNMTIVKVQDGTAFFSTIKGSAVVKNLGFENASVTNLTQSRTAIVAGYLKGGAVIENCYIANSTILGRWCVGSFAGRARDLTDGGTAAIRNCYSSATIFHSNENNDGRGMTGGIIGNIYDGNKMVVENCYFAGTIQKVHRATEANGEGNIAGIVGWIGKDDAQTISNYTVQNNVNLSPYLLSNHGKHRISSTRSDEVAVNNPNPGPNYSLSTTIVSTFDDWGNATATIPTTGAQYGEAKKDGANIPGGDANAQAQSFYETTLGWDFTGERAWAINNSYPYFKWADQTRPHWVVTPAAANLSLTVDAPVDLSRYIFSGRGLPLTFSTESDKISLSGSTVSIASPISAIEKVTVSVQEGSLTPTYSLEINLVPEYVAIATPADLDKIRELPAVKYVLTADLDLSGVENFVPIPDFTGTLDGDGHVIAGLTINRPADSEKTAFFMKLSGGAVIKNLGFENITVVGNAQAAIVAGFTEGTTTIENCYVANSRLTGRWCVGSFIGRATGTPTVRNCYSTAVILNPANTDNSGHTGGIIGDIRTGTATVENCYFSGVIERKPTTHSLGDGPREGQVAGIVAWNENASNVIANNVNLAPRLLSDNGKYRISSVQSEGAGNEPTGPNYSLSTTVVSVVDGWENIADVIATDNAQYGDNKKHGANIPGGDANAQSQSFYETTLGWDFTGERAWAINNSYPYFKWVDQTRPYWVVAPAAATLSLESDASVDLSNYIFSGRGLPLTFSTESEKISVDNGVVSIAQTITEEETVVVSVQEGSLTPSYPLEISLTPSYNVNIGTFVGTSPLNIIAAQGEIRATFEGTAPVKLYSIAGLLLDEATATGVYSYKVKTGVYILSVAGRSCKVVVKE